MTCRKCKQSSKNKADSELQKRNNKQGRGRQNLLGKRLPGMEYLPINICAKGGKTLHFDLNPMPHLMITGGTSDTHAAVVRQILEGWKKCTWIKPVVIDLTGKLAPGKTADSESSLMDKLHEMTGILECRYDELAALKIKNTGAYLDQEHYDMCNTRNQLTDPASAQHFPQEEGAASAFLLKIFCSDEQHENFSCFSFFT